MASEQDEVTHIKDGLYLWLEQESSVQLKAVTRSGDPVELAPHEVRRLVDALLGMAEELEQ